MLPGDGQAHPITPLVRVPWNEPGIIGKALDGGAWGIICPMVNNAAEAKALADACLYPPVGKRSNGPIRAAMYGEASSYQTIANDEVLVIAMIETQEGIDNIDEILSVPGISGIYIGPSDMGLSLGLIPILDREEPLILGIYEKLLASLQEARQVRRHPQRHRRLCRAHDRHGLPLRHHRQRQRPDGARREGSGGGDPQGGGRRRELRPPSWRQSQRSARSHRSREGRRRARG